MSTTPQHFAIPTIGREVLLCRQCGLAGPGQVFVQYVPAKVHQVRVNGEVLLVWTFISPGGTPNLQATSHLHSANPVPGTWCWPAEATAERLNGWQFIVEASPERTGGEEGGQPC